MANCMSHVPVSENHQHYLFTRQKTKLSMLCIKKHYNKHYVFVFVFFFQFELNIHIDKTGQRLSGQLVFNKKMPGSL
jgi:hypothetical protein